MADILWADVFERLVAFREHAQDKDRLAEAVSKVKRFQEGASREALRTCNDFVSEICSANPREDVIQLLSNALDGLAATKPKPDVLDSFLSALDSLDSGSQFAVRSKTVAKARAKIEAEKGRLLNYRPHSEHGVPIQIMSRAFSELATEARLGHPTPEDCKMALKLVEIASELTEDERVNIQQPFLAALQAYLGSEICITASKANADPNSDLAFAQDTIKLCLGELKKDTGGNSRAQIERYYVQNVVDVGRSSAEGMQLLQQFCLPVFSLEINSATLRIGGLAILDRAVLSEPITDAINLVCSSHPQAMLQVARALAAWRKGLGTLAAEYEAARKHLNVADGPRAFWPASVVGKVGGCTVEQPFPLRPLYVVREGAARGPQQCHLIKYWQRTDKSQKAEDVQAAWARGGVAANVVTVTDEGDWVRTEMEYLSASDGWATLRYFAPASWDPKRPTKRPKLSEDIRHLEPASLAEWEKLAAAAKEALKVGHSISVGEHKKGVHGDARLDNIMARRRPDDGGWEVKIIDFGWSGLENEARYPVVMSSAHPWAPTAEPHRFLLQEHDTHLLDQLLKAGGSIL